MPDYGRPYNISKEDWHRQTHLEDCEIKREMNARKAEREKESKRG